ncbi:Palmitoyltransferase [Frankliniella fusca]|uniref:Palmitoyltransferase n=1 Tax=Frankliniella fusca TaxID=407009 RepID=A0AAE1HSP8_9NEOP|nr:Palmitoyltransferase [Frankliniella fusca]
MAVTWPFPHSHIPGDVMRFPQPLQNFRYSLSVRDNKTCWSPGAELGMLAWPTPFIVSRFFAAEQTPLQSPVLCPQVPTKTVAGLHSGPVAPWRPREREKGGVGGSRGRQRWRTRPATDKDSKSRAAPGGFPPLRHESRDAGGRSADRSNQRHRIARMTLCAPHLPHDPGPSSGLGLAYHGRGGLGARRVSFPPSRYLVTEHDESLLGLGLPASMRPPPASARRLPGPGSSRTPAAPAPSAAHRGDAASGA